MMGLEKMKAKQGLVSNSARAISLDDMHRFYDHCLEPSQTAPDMRWGVMRYVRSNITFVAAVNVSMFFSFQGLYLLAWLMAVRSDEAMQNFTFESIEVIPGERAYSMCVVHTRQSDLASRSLR